MKKGFTLIELIAVVAILGLIALIVYPSINSVIKSSQDDSYESQTKIIEKAAQAWALDNVNLLPKDEVTVVCVSQLVEGGYISNEDVKDPRDTEKELSGGVEISYKSKQYIYEYNDEANGCLSKSTGMANSIIMNSDDGVVLTSQDGYYKGSNPNNYLEYGDNDWRILKINDDGSMKVISDDGIKLSVSNDDFKDSSLDSYLNTSFYGSIDNNEKIASEDYCLNYQSDCLESEKMAVTVMNLEDLINASNNLNCSESNIEACYNGNYLLGYSKENGEEYTLIKVNDENLSLSDGKIESSNKKTKVVRPIVTLSKINILKGNGTSRHPYVAV